MDHFKIIYYGLMIVAMAAYIGRRKHLPSFCRYLFVLFLLAFFTQLFDDVARKAGWPSLVVFHLYQPVEMVLLTLLYQSMFSKPLFSKIAAFFLAAFLVFLTVRYVRDPAQLLGNDFLEFSVEASIVCVLAVMFFAQMIMEAHQQIRLRQYAPFWINSLHLLFYGGCLFTIGFYSYLVASKSTLAKNFQQLPKILNLVLYAGYAMTFLWTNFSAPVEEETNTR